MATQLRDTHFGHIIRLIFRNRLLLYPDEILVPDIASLEKSSAEHNVRNNCSQDVILVDWYGQDDPEVREPSLGQSRRILTRV